MEQREIQGGWISRGCSSVICLAICITKHIDVPTIGHDDGPNCYGHTDTDVGI
ncbi:MAG: hypothetical protein GY756_25855 [bacterium]|nr:hypothetical protein [bacterium]